MAGRTSASESTRQLTINQMLIFPFQEFRQCCTHLEGGVFIVEANHNQMLMDVLPIQVSGVREKTNNG